MKRKVSTETGFSLEVSLQRRQSNTEVKRSSFPAFSAGLSLIQAIKKYEMACHRIKLMSDPGQEKRPHELAITLCQCTECPGFALFVDGERISEHICPAGNPRSWKSKFTFIVSIDDALMAKAENDLASFRERQEQARKTREKAERKLAELKL